MPRRLPRSAPAIPRSLSSRPGCFPPRTSQDAAHAPPAPGGPPPAPARRRALQHGLAHAALWGTVGLIGLHAGPTRAAGAAGLSGWQSVQLKFAGYFGNGDRSARIAQADYVFTVQGADYHLSLKVSSALANLLYESSGRIDASGLHPRSYRESRRLPLRSPSVREIVFDETGAGRGGPKRAPTAGPPGGDATPHLTVPFGTQDRISVIAQIAWMARVQPVLMRPGSRLRLPLASWDSADEVTVAVGGIEKLALENGVSVPARRFQRIDDGHATSLDFWLTDDAQKLPAVIRFAEGDRGLRFVRMPG